LAQVAERNGLTLAMGPDLAAQAVPHIDQTNESDAHFITRLAQDYGATGTIKDGRLVFVREGAGQGASGVTLPGATLARAECDPYDFGVVEREGSTTGIKAKWRDKAKNETVSELAGEEGSVKTLKRDFATREEAQAAAKAEWARVARSAHEFSATLPMGRPDLIAGQPLALEGFRREIKAVPWVLGNITNTITDGGFSTTIEAKERADQPK
jgi:phage protein D